MLAKLIETFAILVPTGLLFSAAAILFSQSRTVATSLQLLGAVCFLLVAVFHIFEAVQLFPSMGWGQERSVGHYLDAGSAILGLCLFPVGYLIHSLSKRHS